MVGNGSLLDAAGVAADDMVVAGKAGTAGTAEGMAARLARSAVVEVRRTEVFEAVGPKAVAARLWVILSAVVVQQLLPQFGCGVAETVVVRAVVLPAAVGIQPFSPDWIVDAVGAICSPELPRGACGPVAVAVAAGDKGEGCSCWRWADGVVLATEPTDSMGDDVERTRRGGGGSDRCRWLRKYEKPRSRLGRVGDEGETGVAVVVVVPAAVVAVGTVGVVVVASAVAVAAAVLEVVSAGSEEGGGDGMAVDPSILFS